MTLHTTVAAFHVATQERKFKSRRWLFFSYICWSKAWPIKRRLCLPPLVLHSFSITWDLWRVGGVRVEIRTCSQTCWFYLLLWVVEVCFGFGAEKLVQAFQGRQQMRLERKQGGTRKTLVFLHWTYGGLENCILYLFAAIKNVLGWCCHQKPEAGEQSCMARASRRSPEGHDIHEQRKGGVVWGCRRVGYTSSMAKLLKMSGKKLEQCYSLDGPGTSMKQGV